MTFPRPPEAAPTPGAPNPSAIPTGQPVMPAGGNVDVSQILGPLIDGSYVVAQGQAAVMAGVRLPQGKGVDDGATLDGTIPLPGTIPLRGTAPLMQVSPRMVNAFVQRILSGV